MVIEMIDMRTERINRVLGRNSRILGVSKETAEFGVEVTP